MKLASPKFKEGGIIPSRYTCEGEDLSPPLDISGVPASAKSLVLIVEDSDVPKNLRADGKWDHWVLFNLPIETTHLSEGEKPACLSGKTTFGHTRYGGPAPPNGEHCYFFKLYALDRMLPLKEGAAKKEIEWAMEGHILAEAKLMGRYERGKGY